MFARGTFSVKMQADPPYDTSDGITLGRASFDKEFSGPLSGKSQVHMLAARTAVEASAGYVALERIAGTLDGRRGSFVLLHVGVVDRGQRSLTISIVPDSGTAELTGLRGRMDIQIKDGVHHYELDYTLPS